MELEFTGLEAVRTYLKEDIEALHYITLQQRDTQGSEVQVGRHVLTDEDAATGQFGLEPETQVALTLAWLQEQITTHMQEIPEAKFKVRFYAPGPTQRKTLTVTARQEGYRKDEEPAVSTAAIADVVEERLLEGPLGAVVGHFDRFVESMLVQTASFRDLALGHVRESATIHHKQLDQLLGELSQSRAQVSDLVRSITSSRIAHANAQAEHIAAKAVAQADEQRRVVNQHLAEQAIQQLASTAQAIAVQKMAGTSAPMLPPEVAPVLQILQQHPELQAALADPGVQQVLQDPGSIGVLVHMLKSAALRVQSEAAPSTPQEG